MATNLRVPQGTATRPDAVQGFETASGRRCGRVPSIHRKSAQAQKSSSENGFASLPSTKIWPDTPIRHGLEFLTPLRTLVDQTRSFLVITILPFSSPHRNVWLLKPGLWWGSPNGAPGEAGAIRGMASQGIQYRKLASGSSERSSRKMLEALALAAFLCAVSTVSYAGGAHRCQL